MQEAEPVMPADAILPVVVWQHPPRSLPKPPIGVSCLLPSSQFRSCMHAVHPYFLIALIVTTSIADAVLASAFCAQMKLQFIVVKPDGCSGGKVNSCSPSLLAVFQLLASLHAMQGLSIKTACSGLLVY